MNLINELITIILCFLTLICVGVGVCIGLCLKIYTEIMKEHTIRKRYETQGKS